MVSNFGGRVTFFARARRRIPSQARLLKEYLGGVSSCKICDKEDSTTTLGCSPVLSVKNSVGKLPAVEVNHTGVGEAALRYRNFGLRDFGQNLCEVFAAVDVEDVRDVFPDEKFRLDSSNKFNCFEE